MQSASDLMQTKYREQMADYIRLNAQPPDKFSHQPRLYHLAQQLAQNRPHDDDILFAGAWLHDLGVFVGHRPEDPARLASWDCVAYAIEPGARALNALRVSGQENSRGGGGHSHPSAFV